MTGSGSARGVEISGLQVIGLRSEFAPPRDGTVRAALDGIGLSIPHGEAYGLLGPNGASKTTLCKILSTVLVPAAGTAAVSGTIWCAIPARYAR